jgi:hypothetical protein
MTPATVDEYLATLPDAVAGIVERLRAMVHDAVPGAGERIGYGMPTFTLDGLPRARPIPYELVDKVLAGLLRQRQRA